MWVLLLLFSSACVSVPVTLHAQVGGSLDCLTFCSSQTITSTPTANVTIRLIPLRKFEVQETVDEGLQTLAGENGTNNHKKKKNGGWELGGLKFNNWEWAGKHGGNIQVCRR